MVSDTVRELEEAIRKWLSASNSCSWKTKDYFEKAARQSIEIQKQNDEIVSLREKDRYCSTGYQCQHSEDRFHH